MSLADELDAPAGRGGRPLATLSKVDLPAPLGPSRAYTDPSGTTSETPCTTSMRP